MNKGPTNLLSKLGKDILAGPDEDSTFFVNSLCTAIEMIILSQNHVFFLKKVRRHKDIYAVEPV